jgi:hypothetical protein
MALASHQVTDRRGIDHSLINGSRTLLCRISTDSNSVGCKRLILI